MVQIVEEFVQLQALIEAFCLWDDLEVAVEEAFRKATEQEGDWQVKLGVAIEGSRVKDHWKKRDRDDCLKLKVQLL